MNAEEIVLIVGEGDIEAELGEREGEVASDGGENGGGAECGQKEGE